ncbi:hotdog fold thioesterase [Halovenus sp. WSH3]|uniref:Hotdog fold thioesterase n=1 Tax=Halovenus carboxidivorans TaxID=2692199 RepID=A0A6B0TAA8_9EURY|nr:PaaI family thioesterase [Halovenus carboxidivorans]MXR52533.1 hotdog fold thioesterase [Halovenus carboxidivorans]
MSEHYRKLERMYHDHAPINEFFDPELNVSEGEATIDLPVSEKLHHPAGAVHGTAYFKALDDAAFFAANSLVEDVFVLTTQMNLYLTRPITEGTMHARGEVVHDNPGQYIAGSVIEDDDGSQLARATATFVPSDIELGPEIGYE